MVPRGSPPTWGSTLPTQLPALPQPLTKLPEPQHQNLSKHRKRKPAKTAEQQHHNAVTVLPPYKTFTSIEHELAKRMDDLEVNFRAQVDALKQTLFPQIRELFRIEIRSLVKQEIGLALAEYFNTSTGLPKFPQHPYHTSTQEAQALITFT